jgi:hypothetical protein
MSMGQAFSDILFAEQRRALRQACDVLLDELLDELTVRRCSAPILLRTAGSNAELLVRGPPMLSA